MTTEAPHLTDQAHAMLADARRTGNMALEKRILSGSAILPSGQQIVDPHLLGNSFKQERSVEVVLGSYDATTGRALNK